jgi:hypothetical protein
MVFRRALAALLFLLLLAPASWIAWRDRKMPQFGQYHDDAIYFISAKSLADGTGYRIPSLPENPFQTKYPPVLPGLLSLVWLVNPKFPDNLAVATLLQWSAIPLFLGLSLVWFRRVGLSRVQSWIALAILATQPYTVLMSAGIYSEALFGAFLLAALLAFEQADQQGQQDLKWTLAGAFLCSLAYLTRTAGIVCIVAIPSVFLLRKKWRQACVSFLAMLPAIAGWMLWTRAHLLPAKNLAESYNTDYFGFLLLDIHLADVPAMLWVNLGHMLYDMGALVFPQDSESYFMQLLHVTFSVGILAGLYRNRGNRALQMYLAVMALTMVMLVAWHYPPNLRLMYPLIPVFLAGLVWEADHFAGMLRRSIAHRDRSSRVAGWVLGGCAAALVLTGAFMQISMITQEVPGQADYFGGVQREHAAVYRWLNEHGVPGQKVLACNPSVYLFTGRKTEAPLILPIHFYHGDPDGVVQQMRDLPGYARQNGLGYVYMHEDDYDALIPGAAAGSRQAIRDSPTLKAVYKIGKSTLYQLTDQPYAGMPSLP